MELDKFLNNKLNILDRDYELIIHDNNLKNQRNFNFELLEKNIIKKKDNFKCNLKSQYKIGPNFYCFII